MAAELEQGHDQIWADYLAGQNMARDIWMNSPWVRDRQERSRALMQVTSSAHVAFNIAISPRHNFPFFDRHPFHHPVAYSWGLCCPDFHYRHAFVDGARSYRITGRRGSSPWNEFHLMSEFWGDPDYVQAGAWDLDDFEIADDGRFEIILSAEHHDGNWIPLDANHHNYMIVVRDAICDWTRDQPCEVTIETIDRDSKDIGFIDEADLYRRIGKARNFVIASARHWVQRTQDIVDDVGFNQFWEGREQNLGGIQHAGYHFMVFDIDDGEALVIEVEIPRRARFWAIQLADLCQHTLDYMNHQSSLNMMQADGDPDGKARFVLSLSDPSVPNWLDSAGNRRGIVAWRWVHADFVPRSTVTKVALADLHDHLHPDGRRISPAEREATIEARRSGVKRLYGL